MRIQHFYLLPQFRRRRFGRRTIEMLSNLWTKEGIKEIQVSGGDITSYNIYVRTCVVVTQVVPRKDAIQFYKKCGFVKTKCGSHYSYLLGETSSAAVVTEQRPTR
jgi:GNAT superfamily N-acetyltransferase